MQKIKITIGKWVVWLILFLSRKAKIDLMGLGYVENGFLKSNSLQASGELNFIKNLLGTKIKNESPVFFDVGANIGDYTELLATHHPKAKIYCFEPNPNTFKKLAENCGDLATLINGGIGAEIGELKLYFESSDSTSVQASSNPEILNVIAKQSDLTSIDIKINTIDNYCLQNGIDSIDFLKIDIEGFELEALEGAKKLLSEKKIKLIQFEFNEVNIVKRRFLKDFYDFLPDFDFYRLEESKLIPLNEWKPKHEIFVFQNILAIAK
jgi:FkbM family methyltransferase